MNGECAVCLNSVLEAAPVPPLATGRSEADEFLAIVKIEPQEPAQQNWIPKLEASTSLEDTFATPCGHVFHAQCLKQWYIEEGRGAGGNGQIASCPSCRKPVTKNSLLQVFIGGGVENSATSFAGPSTSATAPSWPSSSTTATYSGASMIATPGPSGTRKRHAPETAISEGPAPVAYQGTDFNELRDLHNSLIQDYSALQERFRALKARSEVLKAQLVGVPPNEHAPGTGPNLTQKLRNPELRGTKKRRNPGMQQRFMGPPVQNQQPGINMMQGQQTVQLPQNQHQVNIPYPALPRAPQQGQVPHGQVLLHQLLQTLRAPATLQQQQDVLTILKSNPQLMTAFLRHRQQQQAQQQQQQQGAGQVVQGGRARLPQQGMNAQQHEDIKPRFGY